MNAIDTLILARLVSNGMTKQASVPSPYRTTAQAERINAMLVPGWNNMTDFEKAAFMRPAGQALGRMLGTGVRLGGQASRGVGDAIGSLSGRVTAGAKGLGEFMTKKRQMPNLGFGQGFRGGFERGSKPLNTGFTEGFDRGWSNGAANPAQAAGVEQFNKFNPRTFQTPPANPNMGFQPPIQLSAPQQFNARGPRFQMPRSVTENPAYMRTQPSPITDARRMLPEHGSPANYSPDALEPEHLSPLLPATQGTRAVGSTTHIPNWTRGARGPVVDVASTPVSGAGAAGAAAGSTGAAAGPGLWQQNKNMMGKNWQAFQGLKPWQKGLAGYGAVTAATAPATASNNAHADWQQQHPIMSWMGKTFGGMPEYQRKSYLVPSFAQ